MTAQITPFVDLGSTHAGIRGELDAVWDQVVSTNGFIGGPMVESFEAAWAEFCGVSHCLGVANGTDALELALKALDVGPGDDVVVPANTFLATAEAVANVGARPVFADIADDTLLLDATNLRDAITPATKAVMVVHLYGQMPDMDALMAVADEYSLPVIEDAAQAHGATWQGRRAGSFGAIGSFSFYPGKNLGALGDGGAVVTNDADLDERMRQMSNHGRTDVPFVHAPHGRNSRLDSLQAGLLHAKLPGLEEANARRRAASMRYRELIVTEAVQLTAMLDGSESAHHLEVIRVAQPLELAAYLGEQGIPTGRHYPVSCTLQPAFARFEPAPCPVAERAVVKLLSLPMHPHLDDAVLTTVAERVLDFVS